MLRRMVESVVVLCSNAGSQSPLFPLLFPYLPLVFYSLFLVLQLAGPRFT